MLELRGATASPGFSDGTAVVYTRPDLSFSKRTVSDVAAEHQRLADAIDAAIDQLRTIKERTLEEMGEELAHIFRSQQTIFEDESILGEINAHIDEHSVCAEEAASAVFETYVAMFEDLGDDDYNKARAADLQDVHTRLMRNLLGVDNVDLSSLAEKSIIIADDLFPSDTASMDRDRVAGIVTERGGVTSHVAILANNLGIPAAVGVTAAADSIVPGDRVVIDGTARDHARVYVRPAGDEMNELDRRRIRFEEQRSRFIESAGLRPVTTDGHEVTVSANIGSIPEIEAARDFGATSVGLFRSEFLFLDARRPPNEESQFEAYRIAAEAFSEGVVILRTLDIGGDKAVPSISIPTEANPFLGYRAVRILLDQPELLRTQLRAALRASAYGTIKIMFPMISGPNEVVRVQEAYDRVLAELRGEGERFDDALELGVMVEIPSAVIMASELLDHVDFVSIGTNDLTQYLLAADRLNEHVRDYYQVFHPAVFRAIDTVVTAAHAKGKWVGVCGELGGMAQAIPVLVGLGVDELSMSARAIPEATAVIRDGSFESMKRLAARVLSLDDERKIKALLHPEQS